MLIILSLRHLHSGAKTFFPENVHEIFVSIITSIEGTSDQLYSEERDTFSGSGNLGLF